MKIKEASEKLKDMNLSAVARAIGVDRRQVEHIVKRQHIAKAWVLEKLSDYFEESGKK